MANVSKNIKRLRAERGLTQEQLAETLHVTRQTVSSWETGRTQPDLDTLAALSTALDTEIEALIYGKRRSHTPETEAAARRHTLGAALSALGALLAAAGVIMVFVYFWRDLGQLFKTVLAFLPLAVGGGAGLWAVFAKKENAFVREAAAVLWIAGVLATNALANSVFSLDAGFGRLLAWDILLTLPVMFLLHSAAACTASLAMLTVGVFTEELLPYRPTGALVGCLTVCLLAGAAVVLFAARAKLSDGVRRYATVPALLALPADMIFACVYLTYGGWWQAFLLALAYGVCLFVADETKKTRLPLRAPAAAGFGAALFALTLARFSSGDPVDFRPAEAAVCLPVCAAALIAALWLRRFRLKKEEWLACCALLLTAGAAFLPFGPENPAALLPGFCFGVCAVVWGVRQARLFPANLGIGQILALLILIVWQASDSDLLVMGLAVLAAGVVLLAVNRLLRKKFAAGAAAGEEAQTDEESA